MINPCHEMSYEGQRRQAGNEGEGRALTIKDSLSWQAWVGWRKAGQTREEGEGGDERRQL